MMYIKNIVYIYIIINQNHKEMTDLSKKPTGQLLTLLLEYYKLNNKRNVLMHSDKVHSYDEHVKIVNKLRAEIMDLSARIAVEAYQPEIDIDLIKVSIDIDGITYKL